MSIDIAIIFIYNNSKFYYAMRVQISTHYHTYIRDDIVQRGRCWRASWRCAWRGLWLCQCRSVPGLWCAVGAAWARVGRWAVRCAGGDGGRVLRGVAAVGELSSVGGVFCCAWCRGRGRSAAVPGWLLGLLLALPVVNAWPLIVAAWAAPAAVGPLSVRASSPCA